MITIIRATCLLVILSLGFVTHSFAQATTSAAATPVNTPSGGPSSLEIDQNSLAFRQAALKRELREIQRCIANASNPIILRDPQGNINRVPQLDLQNCSNRLVQLQRQLTSLQRQANALAQDAQFQAIVLQQARNIAALRVRLGQRRLTQSQK